MPAMPRTPHTVRMHARHTARTTLTGPRLHVRHVSPQRWQSMANYQRGLKVFLQRYCDFEAQILVCLEQTNFEKIYKLNHALKGTSGNFSMPNVFKISSTIETTFHKQDIEQVKALLPDLIHAVTNLNTEIKAWLESVAI